MYSNMFETEWRELISSTLVYYIKNTPLVKSQCILTLKSYKSTNMCDDTLGPPPQFRCGSVVLDFMMWFNQSVVVSKVLTVLSDAARQDKFGGLKVNPDSIKQLSIPTDGSESTTKGKFLRRNSIVKCLHVFVWRERVFLIVFRICLIKQIISVSDIFPGFNFCRCCCFCLIKQNPTFKNYHKESSI